MKPKHSNLCKQPSGFRIAFKWGQVIWSVLVIFYDVFCCRTPVVALVSAVKRTIDENIFTHWFLVLHLAIPSHMSNCETAPRAAQVNAIELG